MKKILYLLLLAAAPAYSQNILASHRLELKKSSAHYRSLLAPQANEMQLAAFVADKEKLTALRYNGAVFFTDSLSTPRPEERYEGMAGYSYSNGLPVVYWASADMKDIASLSFDFKNRSIARQQFALPFQEEEKVLLSFSENNSFYVLTIPDKEKDVIRFYVFNNGRYEPHDVDFGGFTFAGTTGKKTSLQKLLKQYGMQKIDSRMVNDLFTTSAPIKLYPLHNALLLTLDHNSDATQTFVISIENFSVTQKIIAQAAMHDRAGANSFYHEGRLYQIRLNNDEVVLSATAYAGGNLIKSYRATKDDPVTFKNSPFIQQTGSGGVKELKDTKRFLRRVAGADAALAVYRTPNEILITSGGVRSVLPTGNLIAGVTIGALSMAAGGYGYTGGELLDGSELQTICFESLFDDEFNHTPYQQMRLAADYMAQFSSENRGHELVNVIPFQEYFVMSYYDTKTDSFMLRSFHDDHVE